MKTIFLLIVVALIVVGCNQSNSLRFVLLSDTHVAENTTGAEDLRLAVADVNGLDDIDFVLVSGDITDLNIGDNLQTAKRILDSLDVPYYIIPGNHDTKWSGSAGANFRALWGDDRFVFDAGGYRFIGFHQGPILRMDDGHIPREDLDWLKQTLQETGTEKPVILVMHYALTSSIDNWHECVEIIKDYNIRAVFHGHGHRSRHKMYQGIHGVMGRSTLRAGAERGGYNIFDLRSDSLFAAERVTGVETKEQWLAIDLSGDYSVQPVADSLLPDYSINEQYSQARRHWVFESGYTTTASPLLVDSVIYIGDVSGTMRAIRLSDGEEVWQYRAEGAIYARAAAQGNMLVFSSADSFVYGLDRTTAKLVWRSPTNAALVSIPAIDNDIVYIGASDGIFRALDLQTGETIWEYPRVEGYVETRPLVYDGKVLFGAWDGRMYALNADDGSPAWIWQGEMPGPLYSPAACWPVAAYGRVFFAAPDRVVSAVDIRSGETVWRNGNWKFRETIGMSADGSRVYARSMTDSVVCFNASSPDGKIVWAEDFNYGYDIAPSMPREKEGTLFWGTKNGLITAADAQSGELLWQHKYKNYLVNTVEPIDGERLVFSTIDGVVGLLGE